MTAIAAFSVQGCPVVFGDLLITGASDAPQSVMLPAAGEVGDFFENSGWSILGLQQKVVLINERCVVAWAGSWLGARAAISDLREIGATTELTADGVRAFLSSHPDVASHGTSFVGWVHEVAANRFGQFSHNAERMRNDHFGLVSLDGTGAHAIKELFSHFGQRENRVSGETNPAIVAISTGLAMAGVLLRAELQAGASAPTLRSMFGGGYEIAAYFDGRFQKVGDVTFLVWNARTDGQNVQFTTPQLIVKQAYVGDALLLRSARISVEAGSALRLIDQQRRVVLPMYTMHALPPRSALEAVTLNSSLLCHCIVAQEADGDAFMLGTRVQRTGPSSPAMVTVEDGPDGGLVMSLREELLAGFAESVRQGFTNRR